MVCRSETLRWWVSVWPNKIFQFWTFFFGISGKKQQISNISKTAQDINIKFGVKVGFIKCHHFAKLEQNQLKGMSSKRTKLNFGKNAENCQTPKRLVLDTVLKSLEIL